MEKAWPVKEHGPIYLISDCIYHLSIDLEPVGILFYFKSIRKW